MSPELRQLVSYRVDRARQALDEARVGLEHGFTNLAANRLYYAAFYSVGALLLASNLGSSKHSGVRAMFIQHFVKTGRLPVEMSDLYNLLFSERTDADYADMSRVPAAFIAENLPNVERFVDSIVNELKSMGYSF